MQLFRNIVLICAFVAAAVITLVQFLHRGAAPSMSAGSTEALKDRPGHKAKHWVFKAIAFAVVAALGGFLFAASGIMPIKASSGHWPITAWLLNFTMRRSVITHSLGMNAPKLDDAALVAKGATHYEFGCRPCHGGPHLPQPVIAGHMTPHPPHLPPEIPKWQPEELFYIVKHGVKFTGMPAWPAQQRDDEVWAVVAFLLKIPKLTAQEYLKVARSLKAPAATIDDLTESKQAPRIITDNCARCHIVDNRARDLSVFPILAGQRTDYLFASLLAFARGERHSGIMQPLAASLTAKDMREIAQYYGNLPAPPPAPRVGGNRPGYRTRQRDRHARHPEPAGSRMQRLSWSQPSSAKPNLPRARRATFRIPRSAARTVQQTKPRRHALRPHYASGCRPANAAADARRDCVLWIAQFGR